MVKRFLLLGGMVLGLAVALPTPARAAACTQNLMGCYVQASMSDMWWWGENYQWCELLFADCVRRTLLG